MPVFRIDDPEDSRIADYAHVRDAELLRVRGLFVAEGRLVVGRLLSYATFRVRSLLVTESAYGSLAASLHAIDSPVYIGDLALFRHIVGFNIHRGCLAGLDRRPFPRVALLLGNEGSGLQQGTEALTDVRATIRMRPGHDSLNVATAAAIAMHRMFAPLNL